ncbi:MAG: substrate-binding domain-containing protein [Spirochaetales bacterium]|uniref:Substrate-binding domain-containing protein n=1 Tax=Candidatus Thalassospirochaeta sargassi TaxID=3119039 RepID=A0AAJ1MIX8_9SPIO|nr:substrate-binding domain-containing protein [Spirochaetales bacterium]
MKRNGLKRGMAIVVMLMLIAGIFMSCGNSSESASAADTEVAGFTAKSTPAFVGDEGETYYLITFLSGYPYWASYYEGFKDAARQLGVNTKYQGAMTADINEQISVFEQVISLKPAGIMINPTNGEPLVETALRANENNIPLVVGENDIPGARLAAVINHNDLISTKKAADYIGKMLNGKGQVALFENVGQRNHETRIAAFTENLNRDWPGVEIVAKADTKHDEMKGAEAAKNIMLAHPDVDYIFSITPAAAMGAATAVEEVGSDVKILSFDVNQNVLEYMKNGSIAAAVMPDAYNFGYLGMLALYLQNHELLDPMNDYSVNPDKDAFDYPIIYASSTVVTEENAQFYDTEKYLEGRGSKGYDEGALKMTKETLPGYWER